MRCASRAVTRPWSTASPSTSSIRSREIRTISIGLMRFLRSASRNSATVFASTPARRAPRDAVFAVVEAVFCAFCWRPRAWPPFFAAALREAVLREAVLRDDDRLVADFVLDFEVDLLPPPL